MPAGRERAFPVASPASAITAGTGLLELLPLFPFSETAWEESGWLCPQPCPGPLSPLQTEQAGHGKSVEHLQARVGVAQGWEAATEEPIWIKVSMEQACRDALLGAEPHSGVLEIRGG